MFRGYRRKLSWLLGVGECACVCQPGSALAPESLGRPGVVCSVGVVVVGCPCSCIVLLSVVFMFLFCFDVVVGCCCCLVCWLLLLVCSVVVVVGRLGCRPGLQEIPMSMVILVCVCVCVCFGRLSLRILKALGYIF